MKRVFVLSLIFAAIFVFYGTNSSYAECMTRLLSLPETIGKTSVLNGFLEFYTGYCDKGKIDIFLEGEDTPVSVEREIELPGGYTSTVLVRLKREGGWGEREILKIPEEAFCVKNYAEKKYVNIKVSESVYVANNEAPRPKILDIIRAIEIDPSGQNYSDRYYAGLGFNVEPVCPECIYRLYIYEGEKGDPFRKGTGIRTMLIKSYDNNSGYSLRLMINPPCCDFDCGINYITSTNHVCNGLWFSIQVEDSYGNVSEVSEEVKFMPPQEYLEKYCSPSNAERDTGQTTDAGSNVNINSSDSDSSGCSILTLE